MRVLAINSTILNSLVFKKLRNLPVGGGLVIRRHREFEKVLGHDSSSDNFLKKQLF